MLRAYVDYANSRLAIHGDPDCGHIQQVRQTGRRLVCFEPESIGAELERFIHGEYVFRAEPAAGDMWLDVDFGDAEFELAVVRYVHRLLGARYAPIRNARVEEHCSPGRTV